MRYARIIDNAVAGFRDFANAPNPNPAKGIVWKPCPPGTKPSVNSLTEVLESPTYEIGETSVTESFTKRNKTTQEIDGEKDAAVAGINGNYAPLIKILRNHENRMRLLENAQFGTSKPPLSLEEVRSAIRAIL